jgi:thiol-disulfide isomerase/thioredoxin
MGTVSRIGWVLVIVGLAAVILGPTHGPPPATPVAPAPVPPPPPKIKLYLFTAEWCGPCRALHKEMKEAAVQSELARFDLIETQDSGLQSKYEVNGYPTFVAITSAGPVKHIGYCPSSELVKWLSSLK